MAKKETNSNETPKGFLYTNRLFDSAEERTAELERLLKLTHRIDKVIEFADQVFADHKNDAKVVIQSNHFSENVTGLHLTIPIPDYPEMKLSLKISRLPATQPEEGVLIQRSIVPTQLVRDLPSLTDEAEYIVSQDKIIEFGKPEAKFGSTASISIVDHVEDLINAAILGKLLKPRH